MKLFRRARARLSKSERLDIALVTGAAAAAAEPTAPDPAPRHLLVTAGTAGDREAEARHDAAGALVGRHLGETGHVALEPDALEPEPAPPAAWQPVALAGNRGRFFQSPTPVGKGFILERTEARAVLDDWSIPYSDVVRPYLTSEDLADDPRQRSGRWIIDFGQRELEEAAQFPQALAIVRDRVKPERDNNSDENFRMRWWLFGRPRLPMRAALQPLNRYAVLGQLGKRMLVAWVHPWIVASNSTMIFAGDDDYSMGILLSSAYDAWARSTTLEGDLRKTPTATLATFPWPDPIDEAHRAAVSAACVALYRHRSELCREGEMGLSKLYSLGWSDEHPELARLHLRLDEAVGDAYGWPVEIAADPAQVLERLLQLNQDVTEGRRPYAPFPAAG